MEAIVTDENAQVGRQHMSRPPGLREDGKKSRALREAWVEGKDECWKRWEETSWSEVKWVEKVCG